MKGEPFRLFFFCVILRKGFSHVKIKLPQEREDTMEKNILGTRPVATLLRQFAIPSIIALLVMALYNIVDAFFIGNSVGMLGNAATNVSFPLTTICIAFALTAGIGGAANFNLSMGRGETEKARCYVENTIFFIFLMSILLTILTQVFLEPLLILFGCTAEVMPYAKEYVTITAWGFPFLICVNSGSNMIRADGSPKYAMACTVTGAIINVFLDPLLIFGFHMGMAGAAIATVIGQLVSFVMVGYYLFFRFRTVRLKFGSFRPRPDYIVNIVKLGSGSGFNQLSLLLMQVVFNNLCRKYGALSVYGANVPLAAVGVVMKVNNIFFAVNIGISQGLQPVASFNYGAKQYDRVREVYYLARRVSICVSTISFFIYQLFPYQIISLFGGGSEQYYEFGVRLFRTFLFCSFLIGILPPTMGFFSAIGKAFKGMFIALSRQIIFLIPFSILFTALFGLEGILYAGPISDLLATVITLLLIQNQMKKLQILSKRNSFPME